MHQTPKTIIFGKNGFLGSYLSQHYQEKPNSYFGYKSKDNKLVIESQDHPTKELPWSQETLMKVVHDLRPEVIINVIALADAKRCEESPILAEQANVDIPTTLAIASNDVDAKMIHISTDAVFGQSGSFFKETDEPRPKSVYGKTKLKGEDAVTKYASKHLIVRTNFYGHHKNKPTLFNYFYKNLLAQRHVHGYTDVLFNPIYVQDLVLGLESFVSQDVQGIIHFVGDEVLTKFEFGNRIASQMGRRSELIIAQSFGEQENVGNRKFDLTLSSKIRESIFKSIFDVKLGIDDAILKAKVDQNEL